MSYVNLLSYFNLTLFISCHYIQRKGRPAQSKESNLLMILVYPHLSSWWQGLKHEGQQIPNICEHILMRSAVASSRKDVIFGRWPVSIISTWIRQCSLSIWPRWRIQFPGSRRLRNSLPPKSEDLVLCYLTSLWMYFTDNISIISLVV